MGSADISKKDRLDGTKLSAWLSIITDERLRREYQALRNKFIKATIVLWGNIISACLTVPVTVGISAIAHTAAHVWAQMKWNVYRSQLRFFETELKRRGLKF